MKIADVANLSVWERFVYWVREREAVRCTRASGRPWPWTDDEILQKYRFCNVRRMDDKVSQWLYKNWYWAYRGTCANSCMLAAVALARFINLPASLEIIGFPKRWNPDYIKKRLRLHRENHNVFNGAYIVRGNDGIDKIESVVDYYVQPLVDRPPKIDTDSMQKTWEALVTYYGFGSFMAGQVVADLRWALDGKWEDRMTWAPKGPGSMRGINRLQEENLRRQLKQEEFLGRLREVITGCRAWLPNEITKRLEAMDYQNCLCEFDKYERTLLEGRRPRANYHRSEP